MVPWPSLAPPSKSIMLSESPSLDLSAGLSGSASSFKLGMRLVGGGNVFNVPSVVFRPPLERRFGSGGEVKDSLDSSLPESMSELD